VQSVSAPLPAGELCGGLVAGVQSFGLRVYLGSRVWELGFRVWGLGFWVQDSGFGVYLGFKV
jgi:hypothetical protein